MNGIINLYKPAGMSSNFALTQVKKRINIKKVGHFGTLDPLASGVLLVGINKANKLFNLFLSKTKTYRTIFTFGKATTTLDSEGEITEISNKIISKTEILSILDKIQSQTLQIPPNFCANSINGVKAYKLARLGENVELKPKKIKIYKIELIKEIQQNSFLFEIICSSGTYIRSIVRDMAKLLNTCGFMSALIRINCENFSILNSTFIDCLTNENISSKIVKLDSVLSSMEKIVLSKSCYKQITNGMTIKVEHKNINEVLVFCENILIGIGTIFDNNLKIKINLM